MLGVGCGVKLLWGAGPGAAKRPVNTGMALTIMSALTHGRQGPLNQVPVSQPEVPLGLLVKTLSRERDNKKGGLLTQPPNIFPRFEY